MAVIDVLIVSFYVFGAVSAATLGVIVLRRPARTSTRVNLIILMFATVVWTAQAAWAIFFPVVNPVGLVAWTMPVAAVVVAHARAMAIILTDAGWKPNVKDFVQLGAHPIVMIILAALPAARPWVVVMTEGNAQYGPLFWAHVAVSYALLGLAQFQLVRARPRIPMLARRSVAALLAAWSLPLIGNVITVFIVGPHGPDVTPIGFTVMALILWRAVADRGLAELVPIARSQVFEHLVDAVFVTDTRGILVDANAKARAVAGLRDDLTGAVGAPVGPGGPAGAGVGLSSGEKDIHWNGQSLVVDVSVTDLQDKRGVVVGSVIHARDVTGSTLERRELTRMHSALEEEAKLNEVLRAELADLAVTDSGTGLHNRRYVLDRLPFLVEECEAAGVPLSIATLDIDHFKAINDNHGHAAGDRVLAAVARAIEAQVPEGAVARFGGEEFLVLLPGMNSAQAFECAEAMRLACARVEVDARGTEIAVTLSAGVATAGPGTIDAAVLFEAADAALYRAKAAGRNRTRLAYEIGV